MKKFIVPVTALALILGGGVAFAGKGNGKGGKPVAAVSETPVLDTTPEDTGPVETWPPTTTIPFDPGTPITGTLDIAASNLVYGGSITFTTTFEGTPSNRGTLYVTVYCKQGERVVYQWSQWDDDLTFPFEDQTGDGLDWLSGGAECGAHYIYRILNDKDHSYQTLDTLTFTVAP